MRVLPLAFTLALAAAPFAATAQPARPAIAEVHVRMGPVLQAKAKEYGQRDLDGLAGDLKQDVERALAHRGRLSGSGGVLELTITDAKPNRPTFAQLGANPSLSMRSISIGGASIEGREIGRDGASRPVHYDYWETDLSAERGAVTWSDADRAFMMFASSYADGKR